MGIWGDLLASVGIGRARRDRRRLHGMLNGYRDSALLYVAVKLGLPDLLADGPKGSDELAAACGAHAPSLRRVVRTLVALGICSEDRDGRFGLTPTGAMLRTGVPRSLAGPAVLFGEEHYAAWGELLHAVMTGEPVFERVFGMGQWEHRARHPELNEHFNAGIERGTRRMADAIVTAYDFSKFSTVADVGGGHGVLLAAILKAHPALRGMLVEQPHVLDGARTYLQAEGVASRCKVLAGDFFEGLPAGADAHVLKSVIHDWNDDRALTILKACRRALKPGGTLLLVERLSPERVAVDAGTGDDGPADAGLHRRARAHGRRIPRAAGGGRRPARPRHPDAFAPEHHRGRQRRRSSSAGSVIPPLRPSPLRTMFSISSTRSRSTGTGRRSHSPRMPSHVGALSPNRPWT